MNSMPERTVNVMPWVLVVAFSRTAFMTGAGRARQKRAPLPRRGKGVAADRWIDYCLCISQPLMSLTPRYFSKPVAPGSTKVGACFTPYFSTSSFDSLAFTAA